MHNHRNNEAEELLQVDFAVVGMWLRSTSTTAQNYADGQSLPELYRLNLSQFDPTTGRLHGQRDPLVRWMHYQYDALGRVFRTTDPLNIVTHTNFDGLGRTTSADPGCRPWRAARVHGNRHHESPHHHALR